MCCENSAADEGWAALDLSGEGLYLPPEMKKLVDRGVVNL